MGSSAPDARAGGRDAGAPDAGIRCLPIPTPFAVGRVNCYLIEDEPLTLLDTGPNSGKALDELERGLREHGRRIEDLERIVVSHQHMDHLGLVDILARRSGAEVCALDAIVPWLADFSRNMELDDAFAERVMARHGIPADVRHALRAVSSAYRGWGARAEVTHPLRAGGTLEFAGRTLHVHHRPGHSPSDTVFHDRERGLLLAADHLIAHISSNPLITRPLGGTGDEERPQALVTYLASMAVTREMELDLVLSGHGEPITDHRSLIDERVRGHERRAAKLLGLIAERPRTAYELAQAMWGNVAVTQAYLTLSEVLGHTDLLLDAGQVREVADADGVVRFEATG
ncbi:MAG TPA: MBL fold metallo-hydrolase [Capillimicrobium sp.]|nr:MBL fold metallo-hydrolase [Capillimicrobium sp.]